jgi:hypothetical protein
MKPSIPIFFLGALLILTQLSCKKDYLSPIPYVSYIKNPLHGFVERHETVGLFLEAFYQPVNYFSLMQLDQKSIDNEEFITRVSNNSFFYHFRFTIGSIDGRPIDEVIKGVPGFDNPMEKSVKERMLFSMQDQFKLDTDAGLVPCILCLSEQDGKIDNSYHFILAFETDSTAILESTIKKMELIFQDSILLNKEIKFVFDVNKINQSPKLKL